MPTEAELQRQAELEAELAYAPQFRAVEAERGEVEPTYTSLINELTYGLNTQKQQFEELTGQYEADFETTLRRFSYSLDEGRKTLIEDFQARGISTSGLYGEAITTYETRTAAERADIEKERTRLVGGVRARGELAQTKYGQDIAAAVSEKARKLAGLAARMTGLTEEKSKAVSLQYSKLWSEEEARRREEALERERMAMQERIAGMGAGGRAGGGGEPSPFVLGGGGAGSPVESMMRRFSSYGAGKPVSHSKLYNYRKQLEREGFSGGAINETMLRLSKQYGLYG